MTIGELIERLERLNTNAIVKVRPGDSSWAALIVEGAHGSEEILSAENTSGWGR